MASRADIPLFPLNTVLFPGMMLPLHIFENRYKAMLKYCLAESVDFGVVLLKSGRAEGPLTDDIHQVGTTATIKQVDALSGERFNIVSTGSRRFQIIEPHHGRYPFLSATIEYFPVEGKDSPEALKLANRVAPLIQKILRLFKETKGERFRFSNIPSDPLTLAYLAGVVLPVENHEKQRILDQPDLVDMLKLEHEMLKYETIILEIINNTRPSWATEEELPYYPN